MKNIVYALVLLIAFVGIVNIQPTQDAVASAPSGLPARQTIATTTQVGPDNNVTIFSNRASCSSRIISTTDGNNVQIHVLFGDPVNGDIASTSLTEAVAHIQAGSTTSAYDSGIYGCGRWTAEAKSSTTLLLAEFN